jgi:hypothetical protein
MNRNPRTEISHEPESGGRNAGPRGRRRREAASLTRTLALSRLGALLALTLAFQFLGLPQPVTGTFVNLVLLFAALCFGPGLAIPLGAATPVFALMLGQLPAAALPLVPVIALGNALFCLVGAAGRGGTGERRTASRAAARIAFVALAAGIKTALFVAAVGPLFSVLLGHPLPPALVRIFGLPQLFTALAGGLLALWIIRIPGVCPLKK